MRKQEGITLIALVITIIVLLILAGVTIAMLTGENGLLNRAAGSVPANDVGAVKDEIGLAFNDAMSEYYEQVYVKTNTSANLNAIFDNKVNDLTENVHDCTVTHAEGNVTVKSNKDNKTNATGIVTGTTFKWN